jgi:hypothetical protein
MLFLWGGSNSLFWLPVPGMDPGSGSPSTHFMCLNTIDHKDQKTNLIVQIKSEKEMNQHGHLNLSHQNRRNQ